MDATLNSLFQQMDKDFEVVISDNCSTDNSMEVIKKWESKFEHFRYAQNRMNVGFGGNLDKVGQLATSNYLVMLSSDDLVEGNAVSEYKKFIRVIENRNPKEKFFFGGQPKMIDSEGNFIQIIPRGNQLWFESDIDKALTDVMGFAVYKVASHEMLRRCLFNFKTPLHFITVCYQKESYLAVEGYGGARLYNPDKWFNWKLLNVTDNIYFLDKPFFKYRWHNNNQANQQKQNQILKYCMDEYRNCFELTSEMLVKAKLTVDDINKYFMRRCIISYALTQAKGGDIKFALRILNFGKACYPNYTNTLQFVSIKVILSIPLINKILVKWI